MTFSTSREYYAAREQREWQLATEATDPAVAAIHRDMAERYAQLLAPNSSSEDFAIG